MIVDGPACGEVGPACQPHILPALLASLPSPLSQISDRCSLFSRDDVDALSIDLEGELGGGRK